MVLQTALAAWWLRLAAIILYSLVCTGMLSRMSNRCSIKALNNHTTTTLQGVRISQVQCNCPNWNLASVPINQTSSQPYSSHNSSELSQQEISEREIKIGKGIASERGLWKCLGNYFTHMQFSWAMSESTLTVERGASITPRVSHIFLSRDNLN